VNGASTTPPSIEVAPPSIFTLYTPRLNSPNTRNPARPEVMYGFLTGGSKWTCLSASSVSWQRADRS
jgi:hypothetical protein